jgi:hypothetical protein
MQSIAVYSIPGLLALHTLFATCIADIVYSGQLQESDASGEIKIYATAPSSLGAEPFPAYSADLLALGTSGVLGEVSIFSTPWGLMGVGSASGLEGNLTSGANCTAKNGCGVHVHSGTACANSSTQGGHYYATEYDPWVDIRYASTDSAGFASFTFSVSIDTEAIDGKPFIVHNNAGGRVACGILAKRSAMSTSLSPLDNSGVEGCVTIYSTASRIVGAGWGTGLEANLSDSSSGGTDCTSANGCGVHVHSGSGCGSSIVQGGHLNRVGGADPWTDIRYGKTDSSGRAAFVFSVSSDNTAVLGKPFIMHNNAGGRVSCGLLSLETTTTTLVATTAATPTMSTDGTHMEPFPVYTTSLTPLGESSVKGEVSIFASPWGLMGVGSAIGLEVNLTSASNCSATNGCGIHVHSGTACTDTKTQGGHYYATTLDPWASVRYASTDSAVSTSFTFEVNIGSKAIEGKPFVVHNNAGGRVACGILVRRSPISTRLSPLDNSGVEGGVSIYSTASRIVGAGWGNGLEADLADLSNGGTNCTAVNGCGVHVHSGSGCGSSILQGGHLNRIGGADPWTDIHYGKTDPSGRATFVFSVSSDNTDALGKPFIMHNNAGGRVSCGVLSFATTTITTTTRATTSLLRTTSTASGVVTVSQTMKFEPYPIFAADLVAISGTNVSGEVTIFVTPNGLVGVGSAKSLEANLWEKFGPDCSAKNGCGVHVHSGTGCTSAATQGGHYFSKEDGADPWAEIRYSSTDRMGFASFTFSVTTAAKLIGGKPFIVHNNAGERVACGILSQRQGTSAILTPLGNSGVTGGVTIYATPSRLVGTGEASGLETSLSDTTSGGSDCTAKNGCGVHVHDGTDCATTKSQGGHLLAVQGIDPWTSVRYSSTDNQGRAKFVFSVLPGSMNHLWTDVAGKPFIVHSNIGSRVSCGLLAPASSISKDTTKNYSIFSFPVMMIGSITGGVLLICLACACLLCMKGRCGKSFEV